MKPVLWQGTVRSILFYREHTSFPLQSPSVHILYLWNNRLCSFLARFHIITVITVTTPVKILCIYIWIYIVSMPVSCVAVCVVMSSTLLFDSTTWSEMRETLSTLWACVDRDLRLSVLALVRLLVRLGFWPTQWQENAALNSSRNFPVNQKFKVQSSNYFIVPQIVYKSHTITQTIKKTLNNHYKVVTKKDDL